MLGLSAVADGLLSGADWILKAAESVMKAAVAVLNFTNSVVGGKILTLRYLIDGGGGIFINFSKFFRDPGAY